MEPNYYIEPSKPYRKRKSRVPVILFLLILGIALLGAGLVAVNHFDAEIEAYQSSMGEADFFFRMYAPDPFINSAADAEPHIAYTYRDDALYMFEAPEGFQIISHSAAWDEEMLEHLYYELMLNTHGEEIHMLYEIIVFPHEEGEGLMQASYTLGTTATSFFLQFPAFPDDFSIDFPREIGRIHLYEGDTKTTIESMAGSLSHEYGHLFTFYYMFYSEMRDDLNSLADTNFARLREARAFDLITSATPGPTYQQERHRYLFEVAAEDYVQLLGSPTTRQVVDFFDVQQVINGAVQPEGRLGARNAFPQENMKLPLAIDVPGLKDYFFSFIDARPRVPVQDRMDINLEIKRHPVQHNLVTGLRTFVYYTITWNTPYENAIYTLVCYDPFNYTGWGIPIKTVRSGQNSSAVIGEYVIERGTQVVSLNDGLTEGVKVFFVVAVLPDGTFYISDKVEYEF